MAFKSYLFILTLWVITTSQPIYATSRIQNGFAIGKQQFEHVGFDKSGKQSGSLIQGMSFIDASDWLQLQVRFATVSGDLKGKMIENNDTPIDFFYLSGEIGFGLYLFPFGHNDEIGVQPFIGASALISLNYFDPKGSADVTSVFPDDEDKTVGSYGISGGAMWRMKDSFNLFVQFEQINVFSPKKDYPHFLDGNRVMIGFVIKPQFKLHTEDELDRAPRTPAPTPMPKGQTEAVTMAPQKPASTAIPPTAEPATPAARLNLQVQEVEEAPLVVPDQH